MHPSQERELVQEQERVQEQEQMDVDSGSDIFDMFDLIAGNSYSSESDPKEICIPDSYLSLSRASALSLS